MKPVNLEVAGDPTPATGNGARPLLGKRPALSLDFEHFGSALVLHCQGRILLHGVAGALPTIVAEVLPSARRMIVDLAEVDSIDSGGLGQLVMTHMWAEAAGYKLKFAGPTKPVRHLFEITNVAALFDVYGSVPEAIASMGHEEILSA
jgi:anti-sigma B factor antagonist